MYIFVGMRETAITLTSQMIFQSLQSFEVGTEMAALSRYVSQAQKIHRC